MANSQPTPGAAYTIGTGTTSIQNAMAATVARAPTTSDTHYPIGKTWVNTATGDAYILVGLTSSSGVVQATWDLLGPGAGGPLNTLTGNSGGAIAPSGGNINIVGSGITSVSGSGSTLTISGSASGFPISPYVVGPLGQAGYQTVQSAINAANAAGGGTVYIQPGTYTENLTLFSGVDLWGAVGIADTETCIIIGIHTPPTSGTQTIRNVFLQSATHIYSSAAAGTAALILIDVGVNVTNGYTFNCPNWTASGSFTGFDIGEIGSTNDGWVNNTGGAAVFMTNITMGMGTGNSMITSGSVEIYDCVVQCPVSFQTGSSVLVDGGTIFDHTVTFANNSTGTVNNSAFTTGSGAAFTMSSSAAWTVTSCTLTSSNNPAIAGSGAGTLTLGDITFAGTNSSISGTLTIAWAPSKIGPLTATGTTTINTTGAAVTSIGTGGTGATNIGNATGNTAVTGSLTTSTTLTATLGAITATNGNLVLGSAGNKLVIHATTAANDSVGVTAAMSGTPGAVTVSSTAVTTSSVILFSRATTGGTPGQVSITAQSAGSFTLTSTGNETSTFNYLIIN